MMKSGMRFVVPVPGEGSKVFNAYCESLVWDRSGNLLLCSCSDQILRELDASELISGTSVCICLFFHPEMLI